MNFILFCLATIGMTNILVESVLFSPVREFVNKREGHPFFWFLNGIITCYQCCGFWSGLICGLVLISFNPFFLFMCGCAGSCMCSTYYLLIEFLLSKMNFELNIEDE